MSRLDESLGRLLNAAATAPLEEPSPLSSALEARILGEWRRSRSREDFSRLLLFCPRALSFAAAVSVALITFSLVVESTGKPSDEWSLARSVTVLALRQ